MLVIANDQALTNACAAGHLELNPFLPLIADTLLNSLQYLENACRIFRQYCVAGLQADPDQCRRHVLNSTAVVTALLEKIGYQKATELCQLSQETGQTIRELALAKQLLTAEEFEQLISPENVTKLGSRI